MAQFREKDYEGFEDDWSSYVHRNLTRQAGKDVPYPGSYWSYARGDSSFDEEEGEYGHVGKGPKNWKRSDDHLYEDACEALYHSPDVDASGIEVSVANGIITLLGHVDSRQAKKAAERVVEDLTGVWDVHNDLKIEDQLSSSH